MTLDGRGNPISPLCQKKKKSSAAEIGEQTFYKEIYCRRCRHDLITSSKAIIEYLRTIEERREALWLESENGLTRMEV